MSVDEIIIIFEHLMMVPVAAVSDTICCVTTVKEMGKVS